MSKASGYIGGAGAFAALGQDLVTGKPDINRTFIPGRRGERRSADRRPFDGEVQDTFQMSCGRDGNYIGVGK